MIAAINSVRKTSKGNTMIEFEDQTGNLLGIIGSTKHKILEKAADLVPDDIVGIKGTKSIGNNCRDCFIHGWRNRVCY